MNKMFVNNFDVFRLKNNYLSRYNLSVVIFLGLNILALSLKAENTKSTFSSNAVTSAKAETPPTGYSVSIDQTKIDAGNSSSLRFTFSDAEVGATYQYTVSSSAGGTDVTGTGMIATATDQISLIDVNGLEDGTLTLSVTLTDAAANEGASATDTVIKDVSSGTIDFEWEGFTVAQQDLSVASRNFGNFSFTSSAGNVWGNIGNGASFSQAFHIAGFATIITIESLDGREYGFESFYSDVFSDSEITKIEGFKDGLSTGEDTRDFSGSGVVNLGTIFNDVDKIVITGSPDLLIAWDNFEFEIPDFIAPVFSSATSTDFEENGTETAYTALATDASTLTYSLGSGNDEDLFNIEEATGIVTFKIAPDFENPADADSDNEYIINVIVSDDTNSANQNVTILVTDIDEIDPVLTSATSVDFEENGTSTAYTVTATDANVLTYSLGSGNDEDLFGINATSGIVTFKNAPDFENPADANTDNDYIINVIVSDDTNSANQNVTISVTNIDDTDPIFTSAISVDFEENGTGTAYTVTATDANVLTYRLGSENDEDLFDINATSGVVAFKTAPDFENPADADTDNDYIINVITSDGINSVNQEVTLSVTNIDDTDPIFTSATSVDFEENGTGTAYIVTATDTNDVTYSLGSGNDEALFGVNATSGIVTFNTSPDFEKPADADTDNDYIINVIASDGINSVNQEVTLSVTNIDDTDPIFTSATSADFEENGTSTAYTVTATDTNDVTYSLGSGNDEDLFGINATSGIVTFNTSPDFEKPADADTDNDYIINVITSDGNNVVNQNVIITVTDVDETAAVTIVNVSIKENTGTATLTLSLNNTVQGGFTVDVNTIDGTATVADGDFTALTNETVTFTGTAGEKQTVDVTIGIDSKLESDETLTIDLINVIASSAKANDIDITDVATVTILNDDNASVTIVDVNGNEDDGAITLTATLDNPVDGGFTVDVDTTDGTATITDTDYTVVSETLTFVGTAGETHTFTVTPTEDTKIEDNETIIISQSNLVSIIPGVVITDEAIVTIDDDDLELGIDDFISEEGFDLYFNPTNNNIVLSTDINIEKIEIFNIIGSKVLSKSLNSAKSTHSIDVLSLQPGVYLIIIDSENGIMTKKIIKQ